VCAGPRNCEPGTSSKILVHHNIGGERTGRTEEDRIGRQLRLCNSASQIGTGKKRLHDAYSFTWGIHSGSEPRHTKVQYNNCHDRQTVQASPSPPAECPPPPSTPEVNLTTSSLSAHHSQSSMYINLPLLTATNGLLRSCIHTVPRRGVHQALAR
jgi:hypothetical protein